MTDALETSHRLNKCEMQGAKVVDQLDISGSSDPFFTQSQRLPAQLIEDRLRQMHYILTDYITENAAEE